MSVRHLLLLLLLLLCNPCAQARRLTGRVVDAQTHKDIEGATVELLSVKDSTLIRSAVTTRHKLSSWNWEYWGYELEVDNDTDYLLRFSAVGYDTQVQRVEVRMAKRVAEQEVPTVRLQPSAHELDEVVVKATRVKMVLKGDTVVFDASAFNLPEGSMLDALIRNLPGTTIRNGIISVNGRKVSSLLIDGRNFFNGDAKKALENLPAYTVDKVKAYEKAGATSRLVQRDMGDKEYVLDVNLKRQYRHGLLAHADVGEGTQHRHTEQVFALGYGKKDRITLTGNDNNVGDDNVPGENDQTFLPTATNGLNTNKGMTLELNHEGKSEDDYINVNASVNRNDNDLKTRVTSQTFLTGGDYYSLASNQQKGRVVSSAATMNFSIHPKRQIINGNLGYSYTDDENSSRSRSALFNENPMGSTGLLDSLFAPTTPDLLLTKTIHRQRQDGLNRSHSFTFNVSLYNQLVLGKDSTSGERLLQTRISYDHAQGGNRNFSVNTVDYLQDATPRDHRNQMTDAPSKSENVNAAVAHNIRLSRRNDKVNTCYLNAQYQLKYRYNLSKSSLYRLDQLAHYTEPLFPLGLLPSSRQELLSVLDATNSYRSQRHDFSNEMATSIWLQHGDGTQRPQWSLAGNLPVELLNEHVRYFRKTPYYRKRQSLLFQPSLRINYQFNDSTGTRYASLQYSSQQSQPDLVTLLGIIDDSNPLVVSEGNPDLKKSRNHSFSLGYNIFSMRRQTMINFQLMYNLLQDAIATATLYDKETGITRTRATNVGGNWNLGGSAGLSRPLDRQQRLNLNVSLNSQYSNSVDLSTVAGTASTRNTVRRLNNSGNADLSFRSDEKIELHISASASNQLVTGSRSDFTKINAWDSQVGLQGNVMLPWKLRVSTDMTCFMRSGYNDEQMNTTQWIWNLRLSRSFCKGRLMAAVDAFDILGQLNNTSYVINEQGRTETWTNSIPRYAMLHLSYKFNLGMKQD